MASSESVAPFINDDGLRVASSNFKVGFHTDTTKYGLCTTWVKFGLDAKSGKFGLRAIAALYEFGLCESGRVASLNSDRVASLQFGLRVASRFDGSMVGPSPAFCRSGRRSVASPSSNL